MKLLFDKLSIEISKLTTKTYSTSFSMGISFLHKHLRNPIYSIYGFVRLADEIIDSFDGYDKRKHLNELREQTYLAIKDQISLNPLLNAFQQTVRDYDIDHTLIESFLKSMEMDLDKKSYNKEYYDQYIFGSAEVVGLMCLHIFTEGNKILYEQLRFNAMKLGAAFQKVNFLRDIKEDYHRLGRCYFPNVNISNFCSQSKEQIESEINEDFTYALEGIRRLPDSSKAGVYLAYVYYYSLFKKIKRLSASKIMNERIRINNGKKFGLMINSVIERKMKTI